VRSFYYIIYRNSVRTSQKIHFVSATDPTRSLRTNNHTLPSHLRLCSLYVASYDSQGLRWRYCNPPPHGKTANAVVSRWVVSLHNLDQMKHHFHQLLCLCVHYRGNVFIEPLPNNRCICLIAPSLRLFNPKSLQAFHHFFFF
jgi:hypothetical protein